jgi:cobalt-precorrin 5A hydrolase/precorrin-3B C17-methyltransferase
MRLKSPAFVVLNKTGVKLARALVTLVPGASVHGLKGRVPEVDVPFEKTVDHLRMLFSEGRTIIAVLSTGIVVRALGPLLMDKAQEPPVLVISEDGQSVIPLLGGHSGANNLANILSKILKVKPSTTTAGDTRYGVALDSPPVGWRVVNRDAAKPIMAALLNNEAVSIQDETLNSVDKRWLADFDFVESGGAAQEVRVTYSNLQEKSNNLILAPGVLALGIGCERGASLGDLATFLSLIFKKYNLSEQAVAWCACLKQLCWKKRRIE